MVTRSIDNYELHLKDVEEAIAQKYGERLAKIFIKFYE